MNLSHTSIEKIAATIATHMVLECAYRGETVTISQLSAAIQVDPTGETANYFRNSAADALNLAAKFQANPELLEAFGGVQ